MWFYVPFKDGTIEGALEVKYNYTKKLDVRQLRL